MEYIFIYYSSKDKILALDFVETPKLAGKDIWIDVENLHASSIWLTEIQNAITESNPDVKTKFRREQTMDF